MKLTTQKHVFNSGLLKVTQFILISDRLTDLINLTLLHTQEVTTGGATYLRFFSSVSQQVFSFKVSIARRFSSSSNWDGKEDRQTDVWML